MAGFPRLFEAALAGARPGAVGRLRSIFVGGSRVRAGLLRSLEAAAPGAAISVVYGSTEVEPIAAIGAGEYQDLLRTHPPADGVCVGRVIDGLEVRLEAEAAARDARGAVVSPGRIAVRGARAAADPDAGGWVETGDLGRRDADGRIWLLGRASNAVGELSPVEAELTIEGQPWVERAALVRLEAEASPSGLLAVQPRRWSGGHARATWLDGLRRLTRDLGWPVDHIVLLRRLPILPGAAAKVDDARLRELARAR